MNVSTKSQFEWKYPQGDNLDGTHNATIYMEVPMTVKRKTYSTVAIEPRLGSNTLISALTANDSPQTNGNGKVVPLQAMKAHGGVAV
jgi:hypothetical protein